MTACRFPTLCAIILCIAIAACPILSSCAAAVPPGAPDTGEWLQAESKIAGPAATDVPISRPGVRNDGVRFFAAY